MRPRWLAAGALVITAVALVVRSPSAPIGSAAPPPLVVATTGCGHAPAETGSGVGVAQELVLTAAHVVVAADQVRVTVDGQTTPAEVVALDTRSDVAVLRLKGVALAEAPPFRPATVVEGDDVTLTTAVSGEVSATVRRAGRIGIERVRADERILRSGYELDATVTPGDSGAGAFTTEGRLVGIVFASGEGNTVWLSAADEISAVLDQAEAAEYAWHCVPSRSRVVPTATP